ncbi:MAG TPA: 4-hydroxy-2-oxovalerate aldolase [Chloroflexota bacterium]|nr:4-hydroxy-2-oxovalerate aldolase [Chloroflexota bacterium]
MREINPRICDTTLRDGSHAMAHQFTPEQVRAVVSGLAEAGVPVIEVSHGDGLGGSSFQYGFSKVPEEQLLAAAADAIKDKKLAVLLLPGIGTKEELRMAAAYGAKVARICTHVTEADICEQHIGLAKQLGMEVVGFLMLAHMVPPEKIVEQGKLMESYGADCVYVTDSAGAMTPRDVRERVTALREALNIEVGFHAHMNLALGVANTLEAIECGATQVDGATCGLGAGAGNTPTEILVAVLDKLGYKTGIDVRKIMDVAEDIVRPMMPRPQVIDRAALSLGYYGVYSSFLLHTYRAAERFGVDARDILAELGRRKVVGGQEDMIVDVAVELARQQGKEPAAVGRA